MADRQTTGGYPKIATVISADVPELGRLPIGSKIRFEPVTVEAAQALRRERLAYLEGLRDCIVPIVRTRDDVGLLLLDHNLISGVVDALLDSPADH
jgi:allophanate hydrolase